MEKPTNVFVLTTEYHFLLSMNIIHERYADPSLRNILVFTGERTSAIELHHLPANVEVMKIHVASESNLKKKIHDSILSQSLRNLFVFTAYRDLETYLLTTVSKSVKRHLVQDGTNAYFSVAKSVFWSRFKETLKIYRNLWRHGILLKKIVLYTRHKAECSFIDDVWLTNPEVYQKPTFYQRPVVKINLLPDDKSLRDCCAYFGFPLRERDRYIFYLSRKLMRKEDIQCEVDQLRTIIEEFKDRTLLIKLHPNASLQQVELFNEAFPGCIVKDAVPAELYIASLRNSYIIASASTALYYYNSSCTYIALIKIFQRLRIYPDWIKASFPEHVRVIEQLPIKQVP